jgi:RNA polymerase sigma-70 factor (ECF subfamily)
METTLIARAQEGEDAAVGELYDRYREQVFQYLYYRVGESQTAEDLTAEVFVRAMEALPRYRPRGRPFRAWLFQIARNPAVDHYRQAGRRRHVALSDGIPHHGATPEESVESRLTSARLYRALQTLKDSQREVIVLRFVVELPIAEVAGALGKTEDAVKGLQRRGLKALRQTLQKEGVTYG